MKIYITPLERIIVLQRENARLRAQNADLTEYVADLAYRQCLSELGLIPEDLEGEI